MARLQQLGPAGSRHLRESEGNSVKLSGHLICISPGMGYFREREIRGLQCRNGIYNRKNAPKLMLVRDSRRDETECG